MSFILVSICRSVSLLYKIILWWFCMFNSKLGCLLSILVNVLLFVMFSFFFNVLMFFWKSWTFYSFGKFERILFYCKCGVYVCKLLIFFCSLFVLVSNKFGFVVIIFFKFVFGKMFFNRIIVKVTFGTRVVSRVTFVILMFFICFFSFGMSVNNCVSCFLILFLLILSLLFIVIM